MDEPLSPGAVACHDAIGANWHATAAIDLADVGCDHRSLRRVTLMIPMTADVQFLPGSGKLFIDGLVDPSGSPTTILDIDEGFTIRGRLELPGWLSGDGVIRIVADEIGGPLDDTIGETTMAIIGAASPEEPASIVYPWSITVKSPALPDSSKMYQFGVIFVFQTPDGGHDEIGSFCDLGAFLVV